MIKLYLDDLRDTPDGWIRVYTVEDTIDYLSKHNVDIVSLDHDLGYGKKEGKEVLVWLFDKVVNDPSFVLPDIVIHTDNGAEHLPMKMQAERIWEYYINRR